MKMITVKFLLFHFYSFSACIFLLYKMLTLLTAIFAQNYSFFEFVYFLHSRLFLCLPFRLFIYNPLFTVFILFGNFSASTAITKWRHFHLVATPFASTVVFSFSFAFSFPFPFFPIWSRRQLQRTAAAASSALPLFTIFSAGAALAINCLLWAQHSLPSPPPPLMLMLMLMVMLMLPSLPGLVAEHHQQQQQQLQCLWAFEPAAFAGVLGWCACVCLPSVSFVSGFAHHPAHSATNTTSTTSAPSHQCTVRSSLLWQRLLKPSEDWAEFVRWRSVWPPPELQQPLLRPPLPPSLCTAAFTAFICSYLSARVPRTEAGRQATRDFFSSATSVPLFFLTFYRFPVCVSVCLSERVWAGLCVRVFLAIAAPVYHTDRRGTGTGEQPSTEWCNCNCKVAVRVAVQNCCCCTKCAILVVIWMVCFAGNEFSVPRDRCLSVHCPPSPPRHCTERWRPAGKWPFRPMFSACCCPLFTAKG